MRVLAPEGYDVFFKSKYVCQYEQLLQTPQYRIRTTFVLACLQRLRILKSDSRYRAIHGSATTKCSHGSSAAVYPSFLARMNFLWAVLATTTSLNALVTATPAKRYYDTHAYYAMEYIPDARSEVSLPDVIKALGVEMVEQAGELRDVWLLRVPKAELDARSEALGRDPVLAAFRDLQAKASSHISSRSEEAVVARNAVSSVRFLERQTPQNLVKRAPPPVPRSPTSALGIAKRLGLRDPLFPEQWHLVNDEFPEHMMNTTPVWDMGFTGKGVMTSFLDDGLDFEHDDLKDAFVSSPSLTLGYLLKVFLGR
ncbi:hypothetical protein BDZ97DRAFT_853776 [Flammula alnicola]|nr:hypothetical protein BDZ97DRAFT_853776 [Flammula alnicola]